MAIGDWGLGIGDWGLGNTFTNYELNQDGYQFIHKTH
jgi:hypothetical protein